jgi:hypothetical protein
MKHGLAIAVMLFCVGAVGCAKEAPKLGPMETYFLAKTKGKPAPTLVAPTACRELFDAQRLSYVDSSMDDFEEDQMTTLKALDAKDREIARLQAELAKINEAKSRQKAERDVQVYGVETWPKSDTCPAAANGATCPQGHSCDCVTGKPDEEKP